MSAVDPKEPLILQKAAKSFDGSLTSGVYSEFFHYNAGDSTMCLDGHFTSAELRALADHIDKHKNGEEE